MERVEGVGGSGRAREDNLERDGNYVFIVLYGGSVVAKCCLIDAGRAA